MDDHLVFKTRRLLERRDKHVNVATYLRDQWRRHLVIAICFGVLFGISCLIRNNYLAVAVATLWAGRFLRDIQWYRRLSHEWVSTRELLDWEKIESIAEGYQP